MYTIPPTIHNLTKHAHTYTSYYDVCVLCSPSQSFPMDQLMSHENLCGRKKVACCRCQEVSDTSPPTSSYTCMCVAITAVIMAPSAILSMIKVNTHYKILDVRVQYIQWCIVCVYRRCPSWSWKYTWKLFTQWTPEIWTGPNPYTERLGKMGLLLQYVIDMLIFAGSSVSHVQAAVFMWVWGGV